MISKYSWIPKLIEGPEPVLLYQIMSGHFEKYTVQRLRFSEFAVTV